MPAMAGDWPRDPRAYGSSQHTEPPAPVRTLPSVAELLSSRPSSNSPNPAYHHHDYFHARSTPPVSLAPTASANPTTPSYWSAVNHRQTSPPISPTEQRLPSAASVAKESAARIYQEPTFRRQQVPKSDQIPQHSALVSGAHNGPHSTGQVRQDSAIDQHRFEPTNDAQSLNPDVAYSQRSPKDVQRLPTPTLTSYQAVSSTLAYAPIPAPHQDESFSGQAGLHLPARQHSKSVSSGSAYLAAPHSPHEHSAERTVPVDIRTGADPRPNITGPSSLPEQFFTQQNNFGTRQQRYNVRFAANYTSENMPSSQKPRNEPPTPPTAPAVAAEPEQPRSSPVPVPASTADETVAPVSNGSTRHSEPQPRAIREARDRSDHDEPSVERCVGCNEAWTRPIPDMDKDPLVPAENDADYRRVTSNIIDRLRDQRRKADAAYEDWKWRHSHCYRPASPHSIGSVEDACKRSDAVSQPVVSQTDGTVNDNATSKRKSEVPHELHSVSKQRRMTGTSPAPPARSPEPA
ncbi:hypothetical protein OPT61_g8474 [Boeremia exigua]|uniref:Uncharacterized protein n=1 Tax=Boeremia exigua TaxID=749465 RepID=A0ACC2HY35_9PLEO|nr:hypothetical protein OPT61_g8474 [Boeremia exigua]